MSDSGRLPTKTIPQGKTSHVEQQPTMRSVGILPPSAKTFHGEVKTRRAPSRSGPLSVSRPLLGPLDPLRPSGFYKPTNLKPSKPEPPVEVQIWTVDDAFLRSPPKDFPLERTRRAFPGMKFNDAAKLISRCFHTRSIKTEYSKSEVLATCRNVDFVKFTVRIYLDDGSILVVVQRLCGDGMSFMQDYRAIIAACEGESVKNLRPAKPLQICMPPELPFLTESKVLESVQIVAGLLASDKIDSKMLGMESLVSISDSLKTCKATSIICAKSILCHEKEDNDFFDVHNFLMGVILHGYQSDFVFKSHVDQTALSNYEEKMRNLALQSTSNALKLLQDEDCFKHIVGSYWFREVLVPSLVEHVTTAKQRPHDACFACRCLLYLASSSRDFAEKIKEEGGLRALEEAEQVGNSEFALLASEADICRKELMAMK